VVRTLGRSIAESPLPDACRLTRPPISSSRRKREHLATSWCRDDGSPGAASEREPRLAGRSALMKSLGMGAGFRYPVRDKGIVFRPSLR
jgi:hypothetical protein